MFEFIQVSLYSMQTFRRHRTCALNSLNVTSSLVQGHSKNLYTLSAERQINMPT